MANLSITTSTDVPVANNTVERLAFWVGLLMNNLYAKEYYKSDSEQPLQPMAQLAIGRDANGVLRAFITYTVPVNENFLSNASSQDPWLYADEIKTGSLIPTSFKS